MSDVTDYRENRDAKLDAGETVSGELKTSDRVIARVTDGIYQGPTSAFRELVSNAYDADATKVTIDTGYPHFEEISITDDGQGMSRDVMISLLDNIGGSTKRTKVGSRLGTAMETDPTRSPKGRKLIGKIGIGLFAVAQLTNRFQIISRTAGSDRIVSAIVTVTAFREDHDEDETYVAGRYVLSEDPDSSPDEHGTTIRLLEIKPAVRRQLQSDDLWAALSRQNSEDGDEGSIETVVKPSYHIGRVLSENSPPLDESLPWGNEDSPLEKFKKLFGAAVNEEGVIRERSDLSHFDAYLGVMWRLSLSAPLPYVSKHPFDITGSANMRFFELSNKARGAAEEVDLIGGRKVREKFELSVGADFEKLPFNVFMDGVDLRRPVLLTDKLLGNETLEKPMLFVGKATQIYKDAEAERTGGKLSFEAYLYWNSKIVPKESVGAMVRVNGSSGTLFDPEFLGYRVSEITRNRQVTCEIFVTEGLDGAINIDRESYNTAHPHYLYIQKWLHNAFRQFATQHKRVGREIRNRQKDEAKEDALSRLEAKLEMIWLRTRGDSSPMPSIRLLKESDSVSLHVGSSVALWRKSEAPFSGEDAGVAGAILLVLEAYGLVDDVGASETGSLIVDLKSTVEIANE